jgi:dolichyl-phosphate-mannose--protein O-mannosyl transferase
MVLAIVLCLGALLGRPDASPTRRTWGATVVGSYLVLVILDFWFLYPVLAGVSISVSAWQQRMLFPSWI